MLLFCQRLYIRAIALAFLFSVLACSGGDGGDPVQEDEPSLFMVSGTLLGLDESRIIDLSNEFETLTLSDNGTFEFKHIYNIDDPYSVRIAIQPVGQTCSSENDSGTISGAVTNVVIDCRGEAQVTQIASGTLHSCAIKEGDIVCWGNDTSGEASPTELTNPTVLTVGEEHSCAITDDGVVCWGAGHCG
jgi:hypothetical protein